MTGPAAQDAGSRFSLKNFPRSRVNLTTLVPQVTQLVPILQDPGEAVVSRSRLWMNLVLVHWPLVSPPQRELQGVLGSPSVETFA